MKVGRRLLRDAAENTLDCVLLSESHQKKTKTRGNEGRLCGLRTCKGSSFVPSQSPPGAVQGSQSFPEVLAAYAVKDEVDAEVRVIKLLAVVLRHYEGLFVDVFYDFQLKDVYHLFNVERAAFIEIYV